MSKALQISLFMLVGVAAGFLFKSILVELHPNYRWVQVFNKSECKISSAAIVFPDRSVVVNSSQIKSSAYPYSSDADINIPVLVSASERLQVRLEFTNCPSVIGHPQEVSPGSLIQVWFRNGGFTYAAR